MSKPASEQSIFLEALALPTPADRAAYLDEACRENPGLRAEVEALLTAHERLGGGLAPTTGGEPAGVAASASPPESGGEAGAVLSGRYKLLEQIGEGGMGTVWMAQQTEPVKRLVALKVIKPGMDSRQVLARFEAEQQALALMEHPNIARVLDAGTTATGHPFFVMELVKGVPLTKYCDEHRLTPRERLELFVPVCQAIQHAHQKGIIHRDIKPSNVLVARYDGKPVPKVIDFGVAKAAGQQLTEHTLVTGFGAVVGTLEYMSPEQAEVNQLDIDTRSDIYSLGVLLYELLTGTTPLEKKRLKQAAILEVLRLIREEEPPRPSTRLSSTEQLPSVAANRGLEPKKLSRLVRGELDWVVMKALEKDRSRRYETANGLALDIRRYLADEPVQACPPSTGYRFRKLVRRNKASFTAAALVALTLVIGSAVSTWLAIEATLARNADRTSRLSLDVAREEKDQLRSRTNRELSDALVEAAQLKEKVRATHGGDDASANQLRATLGRVQTLAANEWADPLLAERAQVLLKELTQEEKDRATVARFEEIRLSQGTEWEGQLITSATGAYPAYEAAFRDYGINLREFLDGKASAERVEKVARRIAASTIRDWLVAALDDCSSNQHELMLSLLPIARRVEENNAWRRRYFDARIRLDRAELARLAKEPEALTQPPAMLVNVARSTRFHDGELLREAQRLYPADLWLNRELASTRDAAESVGYRRAALAARPESSALHYELAHALVANGCHDEAAKVLRQVIRLKPDNINAYVALGWLYWDQPNRDLDGAFDAYRKALALDANHTSALLRLAVALRTKGDLAGAADAERKAAKGDPKATSRLFTFIGSQVLAHLQRASNSRAESLPSPIERKSLPLLAETYFRKAIELNPDELVAHRQLGQILRERGDLDGAADVYRKVIQNVPHHSADVLVSLAEVLEAKGDTAGAIETNRKAIAVDPKFSPAHLSLARMLTRKRDWDGAIAVYRKLIEMGFRDWEGVFRSEMAGVLELKGDREEAIAEYCRLIALNPKDVVKQLDIVRNLTSKRDWDGAATVCRKMIEQDPNSLVGYNQLASVLSLKGDRDGAIAVYRKMTELQPKNVDLHRSLALNLSSKGDIDAAVTAYRTVIELAPNHVRAHFELALLLERKRDVDGALAVWRKAIKFNPNEHYPYYRLTALLRYKGDLDGAIATYQTAIAIDPSFRDFHWGLGRMLRMKGDLEGALVAFRKVPEDSASFAPAQTDLGASLLTKGDLDGGCRRLPQGHRTRTKMEPRAYGAGPGAR